MSDPVAEGEQPPAEGGEAQQPQPAMEEPAQDMGGQEMIQEQ